MHPNSAPRPYPRLEQVLPRRAGTLVPDRSFLLLLLLLLPSFFYFNSSLFYLLLFCCSPAPPLLSCSLLSLPSLGGLYIFYFMSVSNLSSCSSMRLTAAH